MKKILFWGDSITDTGRNSHSGSLIEIGQGYAVMAAGRIALDHVGEFEFVNRGISGDRIIDLYSRIKPDCWNLEPDVISILVGVNDAWHEFDFKNGIEADRFYNIYDMMIRETIERFPNVKIMIMEPFLLKGPSTEDKWDYMKPEVEKRAEVAKAIAEKYGLTYMPLQEDLEKACEVAPTTTWLGDGVHPTLAGHQLLADKWLKTFYEEIYPKL